MRRFHFCSWSLKHFGRRDGMQFQARIEAFNALNRVQFGSPNTSVTSTSSAS